MIRLVAPGDEPSMAVARRLGMTYVGRRTDWCGGAEVETFVLTAPGHCTRPVSTGPPKPMPMPVPAAPGSARRPVTGGWPGWVRMAR